MKCLGVLALASPVAAGCGRCARFGVLNHRRRLEFQSMPFLDEPECRGRSRELLKCKYQAAFRTFPQKGSTRERFACMQPPARV